MGESLNLKKFGLFILSFVILIGAACAPKSRSDAVRLPEFPIKGALGEARAPIPENWFTKGPEDGIEGAHVDFAYDKIKMLDGEKIIVAVIDGGIDINHPDLKDKIWTNIGESGLDKNGHNKATNNIDDDKNGYMDDLHAARRAGRHGFSRG